jgi:hypothetical protein
MRHIWTLIAAIVIGPLAWILIAFGQDRSAEAFAKAQSSGAFHTGDFVRPLLYLAAAGILLGLIGTLRFSPLGSTLTGVAYVASYVALLIAPKNMLDLFKHNLSVFGQKADPTTPIQTGTTLVIGAVLLVSVVSAARWRRWPRPAGDEPDAGPARDVTPFITSTSPLSGTIEPDPTPVGFASPSGPMSTSSATATAPAETSAMTATWPTEEPERTPPEPPQTGQSGSPWSTPLRNGLEEPPK